MKERAERLLHVYAGEGAKAALFSCLAFFLSFGASLGLKSSDVLFLTHLSSDLLPAAYGCIACCIMVCAAVVVHAFHTHAIYVVFRRIISCAIIFYAVTAGYLLLNGQHPAAWQYFVLKVITQILFIQLISCFWSFVDQYYHFQDAKRLYTLFNSSIYCGIACTGLVIHTEALTTPTLFVCIFFLLSAVLFLSQTMTTRYTEVPDDTEKEEITATAALKKSMMKSFFRAFMSSRFTLFLMLGNLLLYLLMTTTEIGYLSSFQHFFSASHTTQSSDTLTRFYGTALAIVGVCNFIMGWFCYSRLIIRFGVTTLLLVTPLGFLVTYAGWPFDSTLTFALIGFFVVESLYPMIEDNNFNLLLNGVPLKIKAKVRVVIESFSEPVGMALSSLLLSSAFINWKVLGIFLALSSVIVATCIRKQYFGALFANLKDHALNLQKTAHEWLKGLPRREKKKTEELLISFLNQKDVASQKLACEAIVEWGDAILLRQALAVSHELIEPVKIHFLHCMENSEFAAASFVTSTIQTWNVEDIQVELYLAKQGLLSEEQRKELLQKGTSLLISKKEEEVAIALQILGTLKSTTSHATLMQDIYNPSLPIARAAAEALIGSITDTRDVDILIAAIQVRKDALFRRYCLLAIASVFEVPFIAPLLSLTPILHSDEIRLIEKIIMGFGPQATGELTRVFIDTHAKDRVRIVAGKILSRLALNTLNQYLNSTIEKEIERAYFYYYYAVTLPTEYQGKETELLREGLLSRFESVIDFIIQLLGASKWIEDTELMVFSLKSNNIKIKNQAIETLEGCCSPAIFKLLYPLIGDLPMKEKMRACVGATETGCSFDELLTRLRSSTNPLDTILTATWNLFHSPLPQGAL